MQVVEWFCTGPTKSQYIPELHGTPCEWLADLISVTFEKIRSHEAEKEGTQSVGFSLEVRPTPAVLQISPEGTCFRCEVSALFERAVQCC